MEWPGDLPNLVLLHGRAHFRFEDLPAWEQRWVVKPVGRRRKPEHLPLSRYEEAA